MSSEISRSSAKAFLNGTPFHARNTTVIVDEGRVSLVLHGHVIARRSGNRLEMRTAGWSTLTTQSRLSEILALKGRGRLKRLAGQCWVHRLSDDGPPVKLVEQEWTVVDEGTPIEQLAAVRDELNEQPRRHDDTNE